MCLLIHLLLTLLTLLSLNCSNVAAFKDDEELLIGWKGDSYQPNAPRTWVEQISWKPRSAIFHNFISDAEAQHILDTAWPQMQRSTVVGDNGSSVLDDYRTSYGTFLNRFQTPVIEAIERRISEYVHAPVHHQEDMQVLRYATGQYYHAHMDSLDDDSPRMATLLIYLSEPIEGGETSFPDGSEWAHPQAGEKYGADFSECAKGHVAFKPRRGDALLFWSIKPDGKTEDPYSSHEGCPVVRGVKWTTTIWVHTLPFRGQDWNGTHFEGQSHAVPFDDPGFCKDRHASCSMWAKAGECDNNPRFMKGHNLDGTCIASCGVCEACESDDDMECYNRNRRKQGYLAFDPKEMTWRKRTPAQRRTRI